MSSIKDLQTLAEMFDYMEVHLPEAWFKEEWYLKGKKALANIKKNSLPIITLNGKELDPKVEHELFNCTGYKVDIEYNKDSPYDNESLKNITEVHYQYESLLGKKDGVAFESDLDSTGGTRVIKEIISIKIEDQKITHKKFQQIVWDNISAYHPKMIKKEIKSRWQTEEYTEEEESLVLYYFNNVHIATYSKTNKRGWLINDTNKTMFI